MNRIRLYQVSIFFAVLLFSMPAFAENRTNEGKQPARGLASVEPGTEAKPYTRTRVKSAFSGKDKDFHMQLGLTGGLSSVTSDGTSRTSPMAGIVVDMREMKYFGIDLEGYFAFPSKSGNDSTKFFGGSGNLKGQLPMLFGGVRFVPKLGVGYAFLRQQDELAATATDDAQTDAVTVRGPYAVAGFELEPFQDFILTADYQYGIDLKADLTTSSEGISLEAPLTGAKMQTARIAIFGRFARQTLIGAQYTRRMTGYSLGTTTGTITSAPTQNQLQLVLMYEL